MNDIFGRQRIVRQLFVLKFVATQASLTLNDCVFLFWFLNQRCPLLLDYKGSLNTAGNLRPILGSTKLNFLRRARSRILYPFIQESIVLLTAKYQFELPCDTNK